MSNLRYFTLIRALAAFLAWCILVTERSFAADDAPGTIVRASRTVGNDLVRIEEYAEQFGNYVPQINGRRWRSVLCLELYPDSDQARRKRLWHMYSLGRFDSFPQFRPRDFMLSDAVDRNIVLAFASHNDICVARASLDTSVSPLHDKEDDTAKGRLVTDLRTSHFATHTAFRSAFLEENLGTKFNYQHSVSLKSISKTSDGWRIDATIDELSPRTIADKSGTVTADYTPKPILRFAVLLNEECKSATIQIQK
jgi:hypothetical protein